MKRLLIAILLFAAAPALAQSAAAPAAATAAPKYSIQTTKLGELADNPATRPIFEKYFPEVLHHSPIRRGTGLDHPRHRAVSARRRDAGQDGGDGRRTEDPAMTMTTKRTTTKTKPRGAGIARA